MKRINKLFILAVVAMSAIFIGCDSRDSDSILPENPIFQDYYVKYDNTKKETDARATFRTIDNNGVRLVLKGNSSVKMNGKKHSQFTTAAIDGYFYRWKNIKGLVNTKFTYVKNGSETFENVFNPSDAPKIDFNSGHDAIDLKKDNEIIWKGQALKSGEQVSVYIYQDGKLKALFVTNKVGATSLVLEESHLKKLKAGKAEIHLVRSLVKNTLSKLDKNAGGRITLETLVSIPTVLLSNNNGNNNKSINVVLSAVVTGTLSNSPKIQYRNASGKLQSETLTVGNWSKNFTVQKGFQLFVKATGTINGNIELKANASGSGISFENNKNSNTSTDTDFNLETSTNL
ncbi:hypothetical protein [Aquimarina longa]|uniref:hypothetical protein n=1 Tax=Aquimarina longa TaxID=1080221 RepID=UPI0007821E25|nr:hypothetical protein [Aquimarina longa]